jgi:hypothetical protein
MNKEPEIIDQFLYKHPISGESVLVRVRDVDENNNYTLNFNPISNPSPNSNPNPEGYLTLSNNQKLDPKKRYKLHKKRKHNQEKRELETIITTYVQTYYKIVVDCMNKRELIGAKAKFIPPEELKWFFENIENNGTSLRIVVDEKRNNIEDVKYCMYEGIAIYRAYGVLWVTSKYSLFQLREFIKGYTPGTVESWGKSKLSE